MRRILRKGGRRSAEVRKGAGHRVTRSWAWWTWHHPVLRVGRWTAYLAVALLILGAASLIVARAWLPTLASRKDQIASFISQRSSYRVRIDRSEAYWHGLNPGLRVYGLTVYSPGSQQIAVRLKELRITLAWLPLLAGQIQINNLVLVHPDLSFERLADGTFRITGLAPVGQTIPGQGAGFLPWLFQQNDVAVQDGQVEWIDYKSAEPPLRLTQVNLSLKNSGNRHQLQMTAKFPATMCRACSFLANITGDPLANSRWRGEIDVQAEGLNTYALPEIIRSKLPTGFGGRFDVNVSSQWADGVATSLYGRAGVVALKLALPGIPAFDVKTAAAQVNWTATSGRKSWTLQLSHLQLGLTSAPWSAGELRIEHNPYEDHLFVQHVNVDDVNAFVAGLKGQEKLLTLLRAVRPGGKVDNLRVRVDRKDGKVSGYAVEADMKRLKFAPYGNFAGIRGLTGHVSFGTEGGSLVLASKDVEVALPRVFRHPIDIQDATGRISWQRDDGSWRVQGQELSVIARDATLHGKMALKLPDNSDASPVLDLKVSVSNGNLAHAARYYPDTMSQSLRDWLSQAVVSGTISSGQVTIQGPLRNFPFRDGNGSFQVSAHIRNGVFRYLQGWPRIANIDADLLASGPSLSVAGRSGNIRGLSVGRVAVTVDDLTAPVGPIVRAVGQVTGSVNEVLAVLYASHISPRPTLLLPGMSASGQGVLNLDFTIPANSPSKLKWTGAYQFRDAALYSPVRGASIQSLNGTLQFNQDGLSGGSVRGSLLGGAASLAVTTVSGSAHEAAVVDVQASGMMTQAGLQQALGSALGESLHGNIPWKASLRLAKPGSRFGLIMNLGRLGVNLPPPLGKPVGDAAELTLQTRVAGPGHQVLDLRVAHRLSGLFVLDMPPGGDWKFTRGTVEIGDGPAMLVPEPGLRLSVDTPRLDGGRWWTVIRDLSHGGLNQGLSRLVTTISLSTGRFHLLERSFGVVHLSAAKSASGWSGKLNGDDVAGTFDLKPVGAALVPTPVAVLPEMPVDEGMLGPPPVGRQAAQTAGMSGGMGLRDYRVDLLLQRLTIPPKIPAAGVARKAEADPRTMPELHLQVAHFEQWGKALGRLEVDALPSARGWHIQSVHLVQNDLDLHASGDWKIVQTGGQSTTFNMHLSSTDVGGVLDRLGYPGELVHGQLQATGQWSWVGNPANFGAARLNGNCVLSVKNGRLPKVSPGGAGRLLGLIDTRALTRYLALDFSNVFGKGFTFDSIGAKVTVQNGNAYTDGLKVKGPSATIDVSGRLGLAVRDMNLKIKVVPRLGDQLTVTSMLLGGPVVGAAVAVFRNILKIPLDQTTETQYIVTGPWSNPKVVKEGLFTPFRLSPTGK